MSERNQPSTLPSPGDHAAQIGDRTKTLEALLVNGWEVTKWQRERIDARDRLGVQILAFAGVILALMPDLLVPLSTATGFRRLIAIGLAFAAAVVLLTTSVLALFAVAAPSRRRPTRDRLLFAQGLWLRARDQGMPPEEAMTELLNQLIGIPGEERPFLELAATADRRESITRFSATMMGVGVVLMATILGSLLLP
jgi:hypothetical protein